MTTGIKNIILASELWSAHKPDHAVSHLKRHLVVGFQNELVRVNTFYGWFLRQARRLPFLKGHQEAIDRTARQILRDISQVTQEELSLTQRTKIQQMYTQLSADIKPSISTEHNQNSIDTFIDDMFEGVRHLEPQMLEDQLIWNQAFTTETELHIDHIKTIFDPAPANKQTVWQRIHLLESYWSKRYGQDTTLCQTLNSLLSWRRELCALYPRDRQESSAQIRERIFSLALNIHDQLKEADLGERFVLPLGIDSHDHVRSKTLFQRVRGLAHETGVRELGNFPLNFDELMKSFEGSGSDLANITSETISTNLIKVVNGLKLDAKTTAILKTLILGTRKTDALNRDLGEVDADSSDARLQEASDDIINSLHEVLNESSANDLSLESYEILNQIIQEGLSTFIGKNLSSIAQGLGETSATSYQKGLELVETFFLKDHGRGGHSLLQSLLSGTDSERGIWVELSATQKERFSLRIYGHGLSELFHPSFHHEGKDKRFNPIIFDDISLSQLSPENLAQLLSFHILPKYDRQSAYNISHFHKFVESMGCKASEPSEEDAWSQMANEIMGHNDWKQALTLIKAHLNPQDRERLSLYFFEMQRDFLIAYYHQALTNGKNRKEVLSQLKPYLNSLMTHASALHYKKFLSDSQLQQVYYTLKHAYMLTGEDSTAIKLQGFSKAGAWDDERTIVERIGQGALTIPIQMFLHSYQEGLWFIDLICDTVGPHAAELLQLAIDQAWPQEAQRQQNFPQTRYQVYSQISSLDAQAAYSSPSKIPGLSWSLSQVIWALMKTAGLFLWKLLLTGHFPELKETLALIKDLPKEPKIIESKAHDAIVLAFNTIFARIDPIIPWGLIEPLLNLFQALRYFVHRIVKGLLIRFAIPASARKEIERFAAITIDRIHHRPIPNFHINPRTKFSYTIDPTQAVTHTLPTYTYDPNTLCDGFIEPRKKTEEPTTKKFTARIEYFFASPSNALTLTSSELRSPEFVSEFCEYLTENELNLEFDKLNACLSVIETLKKEITDPLILTHIQTLECTFKRCQTKYSLVELSKEEFDHLTCSISQVCEELEDKDIFVTRIWRCISQAQILLGEGNLSAENRKKILKVYGREILKVKRDFLLENREDHTHLLYALLDSLHQGLVPELNTLSTNDTHHILLGLFERDDIGESFEETPEGSSSLETTSIIGDYFPTSDSLETTSIIGDYFPSSDSLDIPLLSDEEHSASSQSSSPERVRSHNTTHLDESTSTSCSRLGDRSLMGEYLPILNAQDTNPGKRNKANSQSASPERAYTHDIIDLNESTFLDDALPEIPVGELDETFCLDQPPEIDRTSCVETSFLSKNATMFQQTSSENPLLDKLYTIENPINWCKAALQTDVLKLMEKKSQTQWSLSARITLLRKEHSALCKLKGKWELDENDVLVFIGSTGLRWKLVLNDWPDTLCSHFPIFAKADRLCFQRDLEDGNKVFMVCHQKELAWFQARQKDQELELELEDYCQIQLPLSSCDHVMHGLARTINLNEANVTFSDTQACILDFGSRRLRFMQVEIDGQLHLESLDFPGFFLSSSDQSKHKCAIVRQGIVLENASKKIVLIDPNHYLKSLWTPAWFSSLRSSLLHDPILSTYTQNILHQFSSIQTQFLETDFVSSALHFIHSHIHHIPHLEKLFALYSQSQRKELYTFPDTCIFELDEKEVITSKDPTALALWLFDACLRGDGRQTDLVLSQLQNISKHQNLGKEATYLLEQASILCLATIPLFSSTEERSSQNELNGNSYHARTTALRIYACLHQNKIRFHKHYPESFEIHDAIEYFISTCALSILYSHWLNSEDQARRSGLSKDHEVLILHALYHRFDYFRKFLEKRIPDLKKNEKIDELIAKAMDNELIAKAMNKDVGKFMLRAIASLLSAQTFNKQFSARYQYLLRYYQEMDHSELLKISTIFKLFRSINKFLDNYQTCKELKLEEISSALTFSKAEALHIPDAPISSQEQYLIDQVVEIASPNLAFVYSSVTRDVYNSLMPLREQARPTIDLADVPWSTISYNWLLTHFFVLWDIAAQTNQERSKDKELLIEKLRFLEQTANPSQQIMAKLLLVKAQQVGPMSPIQTKILQRLLLKTQQISPKSPSQAKILQKLNCFHLLFENELPRDFESFKNLVICTFILDTHQNLIKGPGKRILKDTIKYIGKWIFKKVTAADSIQGLEGRLKEIGQIEGYTQSLQSKALQMQTTFFETVGDLARSMNGCRPVDPSFKENIYDETLTQKLKQWQSTFSQQVQELASAQLERKNLHLYLSEKADIFSELIPKYRHILQIIKGQNLYDFHADIQILLRSLKVQQNQLKIAIEEIMDPIRSQILCAHDAKMQFRNLLHYVHPKMSNVLDAHRKMVRPISWMTNPKSILNAYKMTSAYLFWGTWVGILEEVSELCTQWHQAKIRGCLTEMLRIQDLLFEKIHNKCHWIDEDLPSELKSALAHYEYEKKQFCSQIEVQSVRLACQRFQSSFVCQHLELFIKIKSEHPAIVNLRPLHRCRISHGLSISMEIIDSSLPLSYEALERLHLTLCQLYRDKTVIDIPFELLLSLYESQQNLLLQSWYKKEELEIHHKIFDLFAEMGLRDLWQATETSPWTSHLYTTRAQLTLGEQDFSKLSVKEKALLQSLIKIDAQEWLSEKKTAETLAPLIRSYLQTLGINNPTLINSLLIYWTQTQVLGRDSIFIKKGFCKQIPKFEEIDEFVRSMVQAWLIRSPKTLEISFPNEGKEVIIYSECQEDIFSLKRDPQVLFFSLFWSLASRGSHLLSHTDDAQNYISHIMNLMGWRPSVTYEKICNYTKMDFATAFHIDLSHQILASPILQEDPCYDLRDSKFQECIRQIGQNSMSIRSSFYPSSYEELSQLLITLWKESFGPCIVVDVTELQKSFGRYPQVFTHLCKECEFPKDFSIVSLDELGKAWIWMPSRPLQQLSGPIPEKALILVAPNQVDMFEKSAHSALILCDAHSCIDPIIGIASLQLPLHFIDLENSCTDVGELLKRATDIQNRQRLLRKQITDKAHRDHQLGAYHIQALGSKESALQHKLHHTSVSPPSSTQASFALSSLPTFQNYIKVFL